MFRAVDISHMKRFGVELDNYTYVSNPENANKVLANLSPHDGEPHHASRWALLDAGPARNDGYQRDLFSRSPKKGLDVEHDSKSKEKDKRAWQRKQKTL